MNISGLNKLPATSAFVGDANGHTAYERTNGGRDGDIAEIQPNGGEIKRAFLFCYEKKRRFSIFAKNT